MMKQNTPDILVFNLSEKNKCFTLTYPHTGSRSIMNILKHFDFNTYELKKNKLIYKLSGPGHNHTLNLFPGHEDYKMMITCRNPYDIFASKFRFWMSTKQMMKSTFEITTEFEIYIEEFLLDVEDTVWFTPSHISNSNEILSRPIDYRIKLEDLEGSYSKVPFISDSEFARSGDLIKELNNKIGDHSQLSKLKPWLPYLPKNFKEYYNQKTADLIYNNFEKLFLFMDYDKDSWKE